jgi:hypothetical protein
MDTGLLVREALAFEALGIVWALENDGDEDERTGKTR